MINQKFLKLPLLMVVRMTAMRMMVMNVMNDKYHLMKRTLMMIRVNV